MCFNSCLFFFSWYSCRHSAERLTFCGIAAGIKKYKSIIKKKRKKHHKIVLLAKTKLNGIEVLFSRTLITLYISHDELFYVNNFFRRIC